VAQPFDVSQRQPAGELFPIAERIGFTSSNGGHFSVSAGGVLAYMSGGAGARSQPVWFDRDGKQVGTAGEPARPGDVAISPDQKRVAVSRSDGSQADIWLLELERGTASRFTFSPQTDWRPVWSPDGGRIAYASIQEGIPAIYVKPSTGAGKEELLLKKENPVVPASWSPDGPFLAYVEFNPKTRFDVWILPMTGDRKPVPFLQSEFMEADPQFSPGPEGASRWIAYVSHETGREEVYVQPAPGSSTGVGAKWQVSTQGGDKPRWRRDGKELFYIAPDRKLMAVTIGAGPVFQASTPQPLFERRTSGFGLPYYMYDVAADGKRFLVNWRLGAKQWP